MHVIRNCPSCGTESRCSRREFSEQAWAVLLIWGEIEEPVVDQAVCQSCYEELRDILIDRTSEIEYSLKNPHSVQKSASINKSAAVAKKVEVKKDTETKKESTQPAKKVPAAAEAKKIDKVKKTKKVSRMAS